MLDSFILLAIAGLPTSTEDRVDERDKKIIFLYFFFRHLLAVGLSIITTSTQPTISTRYTKYDGHSGIDIVKQKVKASTNLGR
jgi:hypothetical protein